ncbi:MAG: hypothetical protein B7Z73_18905 [Planctomycetia bacterium 21-64-5]|nr:MAG: hypothetical protein B7Z73_18905 [Planctomycetia bacterium 21-64-5]HQU45256.1 hypothetical protein [Pirellulales bacterium]
MDRQSDETLRWLSLRDFVPGPHLSGKTTVVGRTPQTELLKLGHLTCIDTDCCHGGWLTALAITSGRMWQTDESGRLRDSGPP